MPPELDDETFLDPDTIVAVVEVCVMMMSSSFQFKAGRRDVYICAPNVVYHPKQFVVVDGDRGEDLGVINAVVVVSCLERAALPKKFEQTVQRLATPEEVRDMSDGVMIRSKGSSPRQPLRRNAWARSV